MAQASNLRVSWTISSLLIVLLLCPFAHGIVIYVDDNATGNHDGSSWIDGYHCLQDALADAYSGDEIRIAQGIYKPDQRFLRIRGEFQVRSSGDRTETFQLINGVTIKGGYAGVGEPDPDARDIELYETILSGDLEGNDRPHFANNSENSYHVVTGSGTDETAVLDGFSITAGNANGSDPHGAGGGMYTDGGNSSPTVTNCTFSGNSAQFGGGMNNGEGSSTIVIHCTFTGNSAEEGGGMRNFWQGSPTVSDCTFTNNSAEAGGGMFNRYISPVVLDCSFTGNSAQGNGGGMCNINGGNPEVTNCTFTGNSAQRGGGMDNHSDSTPIVTDCTFTDNAANIDGGGMFNHANANPIITNGTFIGNKANVGGGMYNRDSSPIANNCTFTGNSAQIDGGGIYNLRSSNPTLTNCLLENNSAERDGGGMFNVDNSNPTLTNCLLENNSAERDGGGMLNVDSSRPTLTNCALTGNSVNDDGGGMNNQSESNPIVTNCTFTDNSARNDGSGISNTNSSPTLANCTFEDNVAGGVGGGMFNRGGIPIVTDCTFTGNSAKEGGGLWNWEKSNPMIANCIFSKNSATTMGGGIFNKIECEANIINCTFNGNSATTGGAIYSQENSSSTLTNCILWGNTATSGLQLALYEYSSMAIDYCDLQGGLPEIDVDQNSSVTWGSGNTDVDPLFINVAGADYHLQSKSPCINAGDNSAIPASVVEDIEGNPRIMGNIVDMGAYEYMLKLEAFNPIPSDGATGVTQTPTLHWTVGERAIVHDVYLGTDEEAVRKATLRSPEYKVSKDLGSESYEPGKLQWGTTYYWRVDEVDADETVSEGDVWSFTVLVVPDPLAEALDTDLSFTTGGNADWRYQSATSLYDGDAAQSGDISHNQESWMQTSVAGPTTVTFYWKVSSEADYDFLEFYIDGSLQDQISGSVDWQQKIYTITTSGSHTLEWRYVKDKGLDSGSDCGWLDKLECLPTSAPPPPTDPLAEALDTTLSFTTGGSVDWFSQTITSYYDGDAAQSGPISHQQESWLQTTVSGAGTLSFYWKVSSELGFDFLEFYTDGSLQGRISGLVDWHLMTYEITDSDLHTLEWRYIKDVGTDLGNDCGWVDKVVWVSAP